MSPYKDFVFIVFFRSMLFLIIAAPIAYLTMLIGKEEISIFYIPLLIVSGIGLSMLLYQLMGRQTLRLKKDIKNKKIDFYFKLTYRHEKWNTFITNDLNGCKKAFLIVCVL